MKLKTKNNLVVAAVAAGSLLNIYPSSSRAKTVQMSSTLASDFQAVSGDWHAIGRDFKHAMDSYEPKETVKKRAND